MTLDELYQVICDLSKVTINHAFLMKVMGSEKIPLKTNSVISKLMRDKKKKKHPWKASEAYASLHAMPVHVEPKGCESETWFKGALSPKVLTFMNNALDAKEAGQATDEQMDAIKDFVGGFHQVTYGKNKSKKKWIFVRPGSTRHINFAGKKNKD